MSQIEDVRLKQADLENRIKRLEALVNPLASEMEEAAKMKASAGAEDLLAEDSIQKTPPNPSTNGATGTPPPPQTATLGPEGGMGVVVGGDGQQPSVNDEVKEETKDETN